LPSPTGQPQSYTPSSNGSKYRRHALVARIKLADELDDRGEVERLVYVLSRQARRLGVDLSEETITVLQEVMEGHARARVV
ncbi:hypothetical protein ABER39_10540, partial [Cutibacterium acnes]